MTDARWVAGWNMAGHLPDTEHVLHGLELVEAVDYLKDEIERAGDHEAETEGDNVEAFDAARQRMSAWDIGDMLARARIHGAEGNWEEAGGHRYWVQTCDIKDCTDCNTESKD